MMEAPNTTNVTPNTPTNSTLGILLKTHNLKGELSHDLLQNPFIRAGLLAMLSHINIEEQKADAALQDYIQNQELLRTRDAIQTVVSDSKHILNAYQNLEHNPNPKNEEIKPLLVQVKTGLDNLQQTNQALDEAIEEQKQNIDELIFQTQQLQKILDEINKNNPGKNLTVGDVLQEYQQFLEAYAADNAQGVQSTEQNQLNDVASSVLEQPQLTPAPKEEEVLTQVNAPIQQNDNVEKNTKDLAKTEELKVEENNVIASTPTPAPSPNNNKNSILEEKEEEAQKTYEVTQVGFERGMLRSFAALQFIFGLDQTKNPGLAKEVSQLTTFIFNTQYQIELKSSNIIKLKQVQADQTLQQHVVSLKLFDKDFGPSNKTQDFATTQRNKDLSTILSGSIFKMALKRSKVETKEAESIQRVSQAQTVATSQASTPTPASITPGR